MCAACLEHAERDALKICRVEPSARRKTLAHALPNAMCLIACDGDRDAGSGASEHLQHRIAAVRDHEPRAADEFTNHRDGQARRKSQAGSIRRTLGGTVRCDANENRRVGAKRNAPRRLRNDQRCIERSRVTRSAAGHYKNVFPRRKPKRANTDSPNGKSTCGSTVSRNRTVGRPSSKSFSRSITPSGPAMNCG